MKRYVQSDQAGLLDVLPRSSNLSDPAWDQVEVAQHAECEVTALAAWLLVIDHVTGTSQVRLELRGGTLDIGVQRAMTLDAWIGAVRAALDHLQTSEPPQSETAWGRDLPASASISIQAGKDAGGRCAIRLRKSAVRREGVEILAKLWAHALREDRATPVGDVAWQQAAGPSLNRDEGWTRTAPLDIPRNFDAVLRRSAGSIAVVDVDRQWTYADLDDLANCVAHALLQHGTQPGDLIAVGLPRGGRAIGALLGILRAGAAYLPLELHDPAERLRFIVADAQPRLVIAEDNAVDLCASLALPLLDIQRLPPGRPNSLPEITGESLAYVMYTSGSTGRPKGVEICHRGVTRLVLDCNFMTLGDKTAMLHAAPLGFDASTLEIWAPLLNRGRCIIHDEVVPTGPALAQTIRSHGVRSAWLTAALFNAIVDDNPAHLSGLETLLIGGEALSVPHVQLFLAAAPLTRLINGYGPTETTTFAATHDITLDQLAGAVSVPIGRPINATAHYVLNARGEPIARGLVGELYIGGYGVGRGYLKRPELTAQRFVPDRFSGDSALMYRTGDQVCMLESGALDFVGRIDGQVKIRGFRIETGEIEHALLKHPEVRTCAVVANKHPARGSELVAYVVPASDTFRTATLKQRIAAELPDYMVPTQWVMLPSLPVTANGKLDRRRLPAPQRERPDDMANAYVAATAGTERDIALAMAHALDIDRVGALDNFFDLGGNSLLALRVHAALRDAGHETLTIAHFFARPTPRALARTLDGRRSAAAYTVRSSDANSDPVAVIGMAGRFPGAGDIDRFWQMLQDGEETIKFFTPEELDSSIPDTLRRDSSYVAARGVISDVEMFDAGFFGISPREAELMDPQQRIFLEIAWECLERAGHVPEKTETPIGVFAGMYNATYFANHVRNHPDKVARLGEFVTMLANEKDYITTRTAHKLGLTGPAVCVQTACSTSLVAIAQAFDALRAGHCGMALAGGSSITCPPASGYLYQEGAMLSPDGHTRTFDTNAEGTVFSDGAAVVLLKRLDDAIADGNPIYAVIRGVAVNNDGAARASFTAPSIEGQASLVRSALAHANINARSIEYVEAHGTATPLGDPIEVAALTEAFRDHTDDVGYCAIGSLKSNTGHMVIAAGAGGLIKTALSLHHELLPPSLHYTAPNPKIDFADSPFVVNGSLRPWPRREEPRRAGVSAFGVGGTNAHVILEEAPLLPVAPAAEGPQILRVSARSPAALSRALDRLADHFARMPDLNLADAAHTLETGRRDFAHRAVVVAETVADATDALRETAKSASALRKIPDREPQIVMMFPGQGAQYPGMGRSLYEGEPVVKQHLDACFDAIAGQVPFDLRERMFSGAAADLAQTAVTQPATFALEYALANWWISRGLAPQILVGHSIGEFVAATLAGSLGLEEAIRLVAQRGVLMQALPAGAMLSVRMSSDALSPFLSEDVQLAAENGPAACVAAGPEASIDALARALEAQGHASRRLQTSHAFHSSMMDPAVPTFADMVRNVALAPPRLRIVSTLTGQWLTDQDATDPTYWARHMREPVRFSKAVALILQEWDSPLFLEAGPGSALSTLVKQHRQANTPGVVVTSLGNEPARERRLLAEAAGQLWVSGCACGPTSSPSEGRRRIVLPTYSFERQRYWIDATRREAAAPVLRLAASDGVETALAPSVPAAVPAAPAVSLSPIASAVSMPPMSSRQTQLVQRLRLLFEDVSGFELEGADPSLSFVELGLDSLTLTQVALQVKSTYAVPVTFRQLMETYRSFDALAGYLDTQLPPDAAQSPPAPASPDAMPLAAVPVAPGLAPLQVSADAPFVQQVIQQQMALMAQQLALLQGQPAPANVVPAIVSGPGVSAPSAAVATSPAATPASPSTDSAPSADQEAELAHTRYDVKKAFGAIARIHTTGTDLTARQRARLDAFMRRYIEKTQRSKAYTTEHRPHLADPRVVNGFRPQLKEIIYQIVIERSQGPRVWDIDGNVYIDALNGFGMNLFGWQPDFVLDAVRKQLDDGYEIGPQHALAGPVAKLVCELTGFDRAGLCNTGSEAVMGCVRIARTVTGRSKIAMFTGAYHGIFDEVIVRGTRKGKAVPAAPGIMKNTAENVVVLDYGTPESLQWLKDNASDLAAILVEPVQSRRPDFQPREFLQELRALTQASGTLLIFDEVVTGFRSHPGGAQAIFDIRADLASYGKVVGGGFPIGVIAGKREYMDALDGGHWDFGDGSIPTVGVTYFAGTFVRHPLALAAAYAVLKHLKEAGRSLQDDVNNATAAMVDDLNAFCREVGAPITIKHFSSVWKIFFDEDHPYQDLLFAMMRNRGIHILDNFPCFMTTSHDAAAIAAIKTAFKEAVAELQQSDFLPQRTTAIVLSASRPPRPDARLGRDADGKPAWFIANPEAPGKFIKVEA